MYKPIIALTLTAAMVGTLAAAAPRHGPKWIIGMNQCNLKKP